MKQIERVDLAEWPGRFNPPSGACNVEYLFMDRQGKAWADDYRESEPGMKRIGWRWSEYDHVLYSANPECKHEIIAQWSGVKCRRCPAWFCA